MNGTSGTVTSSTDTEVVYQPRNCMICGKPNEPITLPREAYERWEAGEYAQNVFPQMSVDQREILISGSHPQCFDDLFPE